MNRNTFNKNKMMMIKREDIRSIVWEIWRQTKGGGIREVQRLLRGYGKNIKVDGWLGNKSVNAINREGDRFFVDSIELLKKVMNRAEKKPKPKRVRNKEGGRNLLISACMALGISSTKQMQYVLATVEHETAGTFRPVREAYWVRNKLIRKYGQRRGHKKFESWAMRHLKTTRGGVVYAPYYGRGYCQITWRRNYEKFTHILNSNGFNVDLVRKPDLALRPDISAFIIVYGMIHGTFTGKKLSDYINEYKTDFVGARRIINGQDRARHIAHIASRTVIYT